MQNVAQRGHVENDGSQNKGNFVEMMELISKHSPLVAKEMNGAGNAKYISNTIQNKVLECLSDMVRKEIIKEVKESKVFSAIADETKDLKKRTEILVLRYYYNGAVHKSFLDFQRASDNGGASRRSGLELPVILHLFCVLYVIFCSGTYMPQRSMYSHQDLIRIGFQAKIGIMGAFARTHGIPLEIARLLGTPWIVIGSSKRWRRNENAGQDY